MGATCQALHNPLAQYGMEIKARSGGLIIKDRHSGQHIKASDLDRKLSMGNLEKRLGSYAAAEPAQVEELARYKKRPVQRTQEADSLYKEYEAQAEARKAASDALKAEQQAALEEIREKWTLKRHEYEDMNILKRNRQNLVRLARKMEAEEIANARLDFQKQRDIFQQEKPYQSWNDFLQMKAEDGNARALGILRYKQEQAAKNPEQQPEPYEDLSGAYKALAQIKSASAQKHVEILQDETATHNGKQKLLAFLRMDEIAREELARNSESTLFTGMTSTVDKKGAVVFTLQSGGNVRDTGRDVVFSGYDPNAGRLALLYARKKWGPNMSIEKNRITFLPPKEKERDPTAQEIKDYQEKKRELERQRKRKRGLSR